MKEKLIVSSCTLLGSLATYYYGKVQDKDVVPYMMVGAFFGGWAGELIATLLIKNSGK